MNPRILTHARKHIRLRNWDYSSDGTYFITICCKDRRCYFGIIEKNEPVLSPVGKIAFQYWSQIPEHYPHVRLDEFVIMPNHIHGILILDSSHTKGSNETYPGKGHKIFHPNQFASPVSNSVSTIINQYKSSVKRWCNKNGFVRFAWQPKFHDNIIRSERSLYRVRQYICNNPKNWDKQQGHAMA